MPRTLAINDILKVTAICTRGDQAALNSVFYRVDVVTATGPTDADAAAQFDLQARAAYKAWLTDSASYYGMMVQKIFPLPITVHQLNTTGTGVGTAGAVPLPGEVSGLINMQTAFAGRAFRGRIYPPFPDLTQTTADPNVLSLSGLAKLAAIAIGMVIGTTVVGGGGSLHLDPVIFHRAANKAGTTSPNSTTDIALVHAEDDLAVQRRRGPRGRPNAAPV